jgi:hypothetical protein
VTTTRDGRTFDWSARFDPRSLNFRAAAGVTKMPERGRLWTHGAVLDQGAEGACVGFGSTGAVAAAPSSRPVATDEYARAWYRRAQRLDEWQGEAYDGTSVLAGCLVGRERKLWAGFRWAKTPAELAAGILDDSLGPAIVGVQWSEELYEPPASGLLPATVDLDPEMGHCVLLFGYVPAPGHMTPTLEQQVEELGLAAAVDQLTEPAFLLLNSWGPSWGVGGRAVAPLSLVRRWVSARGEFALPENRTKGTRVTSTEQTTEQEPAPDAGEEQTTEQEPGDRTHHLTAQELMEGDRLLDPPEEVGQESVTVRSIRAVRNWSGQRVVVNTTAGSFQLGAADPVTVRRTGGEQ